MTLKADCSASIWPPGAWRSHPCEKAAKVEREGKPYCGVHDPERVAARRAVRDAAYDKASRRTAAEYALKEAVRLAGGALADYPHPEDIPEALLIFRIKILDARQILKTL